NPLLRTASSAGFQVGLFEHWDRDAFAEPGFGAFR
ncbi:aspartate aminotransferase, partial [Streptomyces sp. NBRC 110611]